MDKPAESAVERYEAWSEDTKDWTPTEGRILADAAIAELKTRIEEQDKAFHYWRLALMRVLSCADSSPDVLVAVAAAEKQRADEAEAQRDQARAEVHKAIDDRFRALDIARARGRQRDEYQKLYAEAEATLATLRARMDSDCTDCATGIERQKRIDAERFINRFIIHDGEAKPYSVREGQVMLEQAEDLNCRAADLLRDACLRYNGPQDDGLHRAVGKWLDDFKGRRLP